MTSPRTPTVTKDPQGGPLPSPLIQVACAAAHLHFTPAARVILALPVCENLLTRVGARSTGAQVVYCDHRNGCRLQTSDDYHLRQTEYGGQGGAQQGMKGGRRGLAVGGRTTCGARPTSKADIKSFLCVKLLPRSLCNMTSS